MKRVGEDFTKKHEDLIKEQDKLIDRYFEDINEEEFLHDSSSKDECTNEECSGSPNKSGISTPGNGEKEKQMEPLQKGKSAMWKEASQLVNKSVVVAAFAKKTSSNGYNFVKIIK